MKTNQMMTVTIGDYGDVLIGHKTKMGKAKDIMAMGNLTRELRGLRPIELDSILKSQNFWEFVVSYHNSNWRDSRYLESDSNYPQMVGINFDSNSVESTELKIDFDMVKNKSGQIEYKKLIPMFPELIQTKRGKYGGTWMNLYLLLKLATKLDTDLEVQIYKTFVEGSILEYRDEGGTNFNRLKQLLQDRFCVYKASEESRVFSRALRENVFGREVVSKFKEENPTDNIWNSDLATDEIQKERTKLEDKLCMLITEDFIKTKEDLLKYISPNFRLPQPYTGDFFSRPMEYTSNQS